MEFINLNKELFRLGGQQIPNITPNIMAQMGLSRTFQNLALFKRMSVLDNILVGRKLHTKTNFLEVALQLPKVKKEEKLNRERSEEIISFLEIEDIKDTPVGKLPYGLQKKVRIRPCSCNRLYNNFIR